MNDVLNIQLGDNQSDVVIFNSLGQEVRRIEMASGTIQVDMEGLNAGVYFVKTNGEISKVIKK
jgi:hypothetical protein